ncbi:hypothetical protein BU26DRAFT_229567 [Trematosphaeria pertusa]|uniref:Heterokaryon incompatibility domain-containing protein n=1 Tax=Trematosphaeria pertusa TaxID=390896 RepID=A0A6A6IX39_9PLEO|nr:uncharacterized protein BU26DRAFT_229567 [Trematosphaeria pertusa]KAF2253773.1 hypothetical protein BU26DRAFT_229567 [Trematosphaeria pertusa]
MNMPRNAAIMTLQPDMTTLVQRDNSAEMDHPQSANIGRARLDDAELDSFFNGNVPEPEDRVGRRGVPDNRMQFREPHPGSDLWKSAKPKINLLARIGVKAGKFKYMQISGDQIRLLRVRPGKQGERLVCDLCAKSLAEMKGKYEALSYCWGTEDPSEAIYIHRLKLKGSGPDYTISPQEEFPVRPNLLKALRHLRREDRGVVIWVDAVCIDQRETAEARREKNRQLSMMSDIYNSAKSICIWLGDSDKDSTTALKLAHDIANFQVLDQRLNATDESTGDRWCALVRTLSTTPWFTRRWIIQEIASARHASVHCGNDVLHWDDLADAISLLQENHERLKRQYDKDIFSTIPTLSATHLVKALTGVCRKSPNGDIVERLFDLETLVCTFQHFHARDAQDVIHAVRSLARDAPGEDESDSFRLGAEHKNSTRDLFIAFVRRCVQNSGSLDIICRHWAPPITDTAGERIKLPTWISELSNGPFGLPGESQERQNGENFVALSPLDKRKRYNASQDWGQSKTPSTRSDPREKPVLSVPQYSNLDPNSRSLTGAEFTASPFTSPALEKSNPYHTHGLDTVGGATSTEDQLEHDQRLSVMEQAPLSSSSRPLDKQNALPNSTGLPPIQTAVENSNGVEGESDKRSSKETQMPDSPHPARYFANAAVFPGRLRQQPERRGSISKQDKWIQNDQEHHPKEPGLLDVEGIILGAIRQCSDLMREGIVSGDWLEKLGWDRQSHENRVPDVLWRTLVADRSPDGGNPPRWYQRACLHCLKDVRLTNSKGDLISHMSGRVIESMSSVYLKRVESVIWRRRLIEIGSNIPPKGIPLYGLAPEKTKERDIVCILVGCSVPVVLRRVQSPGTTKVYELIGEAFIYGMMDGEAVQDTKAVNGLKETFLLR